MIRNDLQLLDVDQDTVLFVEYFVSIKRKCQIKKKVKYTENEKSMLSFSALVLLCGVCKTHCSFHWDADNVIQAVMGRQLVKSVSGEMVFLSKKENAHFFVAEPFSA